MKKCEHALLLGTSEYVIFLVASFQKVFFCFGSNLPKKVPNYLRKENVLRRVIWHLFWRAKVKHSQIKPPLQTLTKISHEFRKWLLLIQVAYNHIKCMNLIGHRMSPSKRLPVLTFRGLYRFESFSNRNMKTMPICDKVDKNNSMRPIFSIFDKSPFLFWSDEGIFGFEISFDQKRRRLVRRL